MEAELVEIDQRQIQKLGGQYVYYPTAKVIEDLVKPLDPSVLDVTYGKGRFYYFYRPRVLIASDPYKREWIVEPDIFYQLPVWALYHKLKKGEVRLPDISLIVIDPPWGRNNHRREYSEPLGTPDLIIQYAHRIAQTLRAEYILVHYNKTPQLNGYKPQRTVKYRFLARTLHIEETNNTSYFTLYTREK
jgi:hypothetical protein